MSQVLNWGILGTANIARAQVIPAIARAKLNRVVAIASRDLKKAAAYVHDSGQAAEIVSYSDLLTHPKVDAIYIPLPNTMHAEWAIRAAEAGKAVLCEKPLATSAEDARRIISAFERSQTPLMEGFMYRFHPQNVRVLELIAQGAIGEVREVRAHLSVNFYDSADPSNIRFHRDLGGGVLLDMGCYTANVSRTIIGSEPISVSAEWDVDPRAGVDTSVAAIMRFPAGRVALISCSMHANGQGTYSVIGTKGTIEVPRAIIPGLGTRAAEGLVNVVDADGNRVEEKIPPVDQYQLMIEAFSTALLSGKDPPISTSDALNNMITLDAIAESSRARAWIDIESSNIAQEDASPSSRRS